MSLVDLGATVWFAATFDRLDYLPHLDTRHTTRRGLGLLQSEPNNNYSNLHLQHLSENTLPFQLSAVKAGDEAMDVDTPIHDEDSDTDGTGSEDSQPVESLVAGRVRRANAGNLMAAQLQVLEHGQEATTERDVEEDDLALLFAEGEEDEDQEFESDAEDNSDAQLSSDDDDDQGPTVVGDGALDGEKEIQRQEKAVRAKKRKAQVDFAIPPRRKKVVAEAPSETADTPAPRPKKKSERASWLPTAEEGPVRASARKQTKINKQIVHARLKEGEAKRVKVLAKMAAAEARKEKSRPKQMTQADKLAEAEETERLNSKDLNKWEEMERRRAEDQQAKLEAMRNKRLEGPVVTYLSSRATWLNGALVTASSKDKLEEPESVANTKSKSSRTESEDHDEMQVVNRVAGHNNTTTKSSTTVVDQMPQDNEPDKPPEGVTSHNSTQITFAPPQGPESFLSGIHQYATMPEETPPVLASDTSLATGVTGPPTDTIGPQTTDAQVLPPLGMKASGEPPSAAPKIAASTPMTTASQTHTDPVQPPGSPPPLVREQATRNLVILENFDPRAPQDRGEFSVFFNKKPPSTKSQSKPSSLSSQESLDSHEVTDEEAEPPPPELCAITSLPARYRDPATGLAYANTYAFREIQRIKEHHFAWSNLLGCYVGGTRMAARGVPEDFHPPIDSGNVA